ncbi:hypothetical protein PVAG01_02010 [Phlyctema vagabunda]|uniref:Ribosomal protein S21 n=1 Tax=Phlyctema vagabunda TaxID=108571 RepID=A0ABR4PZ00_9HELO
MEIRRAADAMLRCQKSPIGALLTTSSRSPVGRRAFTQTCHVRAPPPRTTTSAKPSSSQSRGPARNLDWTAGRSARTPAPSSTSTVEQKMDKDDMGSLGEIFSMVSRKADRSRMPAKSFDFLQMKQPRGARDPGVMGAMNEIAAFKMPKASTKVPLKLNPRLGRTVTVGGNVDLGRAMRLLEQSCARNKIRADFTRQRFYERPGMKKKRLRRVGWRKRFRQAFSATVIRVKQLRRQGW